MQDFRNIELANNLTLEPRLQEYWKKISYYKNNNIAPSSNLEKEFGITEEDRMKLKTFLGNRNINFPVTQEKYEVPENQGFQIKYEDYKKDPRYERLQQKLQRDKDANASKYSYGKGPETCGFKNSMNSTSGFTDEQYFQQEEKNHFLDNIPPYNSDYALNVRHKSPRVYDSSPPKIQYKQYLPYSQSGDSRELPHDDNLDCIINKLATYRNNTNTIYQYPHDMDHEIKINRNNHLEQPAPVQRANKNSLNVYDTDITKSYQAVPLKGRGVNAIGGTRDFDEVNNVYKGLPERDAKFKSLGYPNYADHSFQYISEDIQDPNHVVLPFPRGGVPSRLENNYRRAKPYKRDVY